MCPHCNVRSGEKVTRESGPETQASRKRVLGTQLLLFQNNDKYILTIDKLTITIKIQNFTRIRMKRGSTIFLQVLVVLLGIGALTFLLWEPHVEGVNAHATLFQMYFNAFVVFVYIASIPFFVALYQAFKVLGYVRQNQAFSQASVNALRTIKYCAMALIGLVAVSVVFMVSADKDDRPAGLFMRILVTFPSVVIATAAAMFERILQNAVDTKSENDSNV